MSKQCFMKLLSLLSKLLAPKEEATEPVYVLEPPTSTLRISHDELKALLRGAAPFAGLYISDRSFLLCNNDDIARFLVEDETNHTKYETEVYDCDNFSYRLMGQLSIPQWSDLSFGIIWTKGHALNCLVTESRELLLVEPQTDEISVLSDQYTPEDIRVIMM